MVGIGVRFDEHRGDAERDRGPRQNRSELALTAGRRALPARLDKLR